jgi:hypothetical protein
MNELIYTRLVSHFPLDTFSYMQRRVWYAMHLPCSYITYNKLSNVLMMGGKLICPMGGIKIPFFAILS